MLCPFCNHNGDKVLDSRERKDGLIIRRRRECLECHKRFTTYERIEDIPAMVVKKDTRREPFDRSKLLNGLLRACEKRPISMTTLDEIADEVEQALHEKAGKEISSAEIGEMVINRLYNLDEIAYVRFASVYRQFKDINQFMQELANLLKSKER
ncbi:MAG: transcriptional repressor NrdR [Candidatus Schekmanbacteria bacterium]|nr:transcriptional repressor NrdR [Candidatus Schekmanbacteria bacterium]